MLPGITLLWLCGPSAALAEPVASARSAQSVFFIARSENRNQVHYGIRLDGDCRPRGQQPVYVYWRMFEKGEREVEPLLGVEEPIYGLADEQQVESTPEGWRVRIILRAFANRPIDLAVTRENGVCTVQASTKVVGAVARLDHVFVQNAWPFGIDHLLINGVGADGRAVREKVEQ
jgi:hypothetical protein